MTHMMGMVIKKKALSILEKRKAMWTALNVLHEFPEREKIDSIHLSLYGASIFLRWTWASSREVVSSLACSRSLSQGCLMEIHMESFFCPWQVGTFLNTVNAASSQWQINSIPVYICLSFQTLAVLSFLWRAVFIWEPEIPVYIPELVMFLIMRLFWWNNWCEPIFSNMEVFWELLVSSVFFQNITTIL